MAPPLITTAHTHLLHSATLYTTTHPALSAHLLSRAESLRCAHPTLPAPAHATCSCCNTTKLPGLNGAVRTNRGEMVWSCGACGKESATVVARPKRKRKVERRRERVGEGEGVVESGEMNEIVGAEAGSSATTNVVVGREATKAVGVKKKRAKVKGGHLAALLAKKKEGEKKGFGLMDLMQIG